MIGTSPERLLRSDDEEQQRGAGGASAPAVGASIGRLLRYLPLALILTLAVTVLPVLIAAMLIPRGGALLIALAAVVAVLLSLALANAGEALWKRWPGSRDLLFAHLMLWGWLRRYWVEWRLRDANAVYESLQKASPGVSVELLERTSGLLEARDGYTYRHSRRVARHAVRIARALHLPPEQIAKIRAAAAVHDVGKIYTPRSILNKPGPLTEAEFEVIKRHPIDGADMLGPAGDREVTAMVRHHHERIDGAGYPDGVPGERIPLGARIIAVADAFDVITSWRPYQRARSHKQAFEILEAAAGTQFDGEVVAAFRQSYAPRRPIALLALLAIVPEQALASLGASSGIGASSGLVTSIAPALGAAGVLAFGHGHHLSDLHVRAYRSPNPAHHHHLLRPAPLRPQRHELARHLKHPPPASPRHSGGTPHPPPLRTRRLPSTPRSTASPAPVRSLAPTSGVPAAPTQQPPASAGSPTSASQPPATPPATTTTISTATTTTTTTATAPPHAGPLPIPEVPKVEVPAIKASIAAGKAARCAAAPSNIRVGACSFRNSG